jgi:glycosyltransferase involved in cell wall biosynthesis
MNLVLFNNNRSWGGGEKWHFEAAKAMHSEGIHVTVFCHPESELFVRLKQTTIPVSTFPISNLSWLNIFKLRKLSQLLLQTGANIIILNQSSDIKSAGIAARMAGFSQIIYRRGSAIPIRNTWLNRMLFRNVITHVIANSETTKLTINANHPGLFDHHAIKVVYNGINTMAPIIRKSPDWFNKIPGEIVIGNAGRMVPQKAQSDLIKLASILKNKGIPFKIIIAGDGKLRAELIKESEKSGVAGHILFPGFIKDIGEMLSITDIFVLTSRWEGFGYVLAEAMCYGVPLVGYNVSSNPELIFDGKNGFLVKTGDIEELAKTILYMSSDPELRKKMGEKGREIASLHFDFNTNIKILTEWISKNQ